MNYKKVYIHYGSTSFEKSLFNKIENKPWVKPRGGLWGSPIDSPRSWKRFVESNEDMDFKDIRKGFKFILDDNANILHIYSVNDLLDLPKIDNRELLMIWLDFEKLVEDGYDAIELHLSEEKIDYNNHIIGESLSCKLYCWDCDSILIMNPDIIIQI